MDLASELQECRQEGFLQDILTHPKMRQMIRAEIEAFEGETKTLQMGTGIPKLVNEIYESIEAISKLKLREVAN